MLSEMGVSSVIGGGDEGFGCEDVGLLLQRRQEAGDRERELSLYRSGSAPPTVEGSAAAMGGRTPGFGGGNGYLPEYALVSDPDYAAYYHSNGKLNPRLPPLVLAKEDWRLSQRRLGVGGLGLGGIGDRRRVNQGAGDEEGGRSRSFFPAQQRFNGCEVESRKTPGSGDWLDGGEDGLIGLSGMALGRQRSFVNVNQDDPLCHKTPVSAHPSCSGYPEAHFDLHQGVASAERLQHGEKAQSVSGLQKTVFSGPQSFASVSGPSISRSTTPDPHLMAQAHSPRLLPVGAKLDTNYKNNKAPCSFSGVSSNITESDDLLAALSAVSLSTSSAADVGSATQINLQQKNDDHRNFLFDLQGSQRPFQKSELGHVGMPSVTPSSKPSYSDSTRALMDLRNSMSGLNGQLPDRSQSVNGGNEDFTGYRLGAHFSPRQPVMTNHVGSVNFPPLFENVAAASQFVSLGIDSQTVGGLPLGSYITGEGELQQMPLMDPLYIQRIKMAGYASHAAPKFGDASMDRGFMGDSNMNLIELQKAYLNLLFQSQENCGMSFPNTYGALCHSYQGNPPYSLGVTYPTKSPHTSPVLSASPVGFGSGLRRSDREIHVPSGLRNFPGDIMGKWHSNPSGGMEEGFSSSLLEEFKSNKTKCFDLFEIAGHVVEFSADQYGSRFIQQKLETATPQEKNMVFEEIMPQALSLMTDVFGNYVVQKFFEHGSAAQIRELADKLNGNVLTLSLQMYGCRVIQKAIEVVELDQKTKMVAELDGHVMRCVRDQNGNHVIQKCIECIPQDVIQFIITTFYDQIVTLSTHPYGCRVIQRILEHCDDPKTQKIVMDETMRCVCMLAQDQYGNYVIQHVLEHGKPHERSAIIKKLAGQIVQMSQQKFASNVVEKCLAYGGPEEREILVKEMLGSTDENEPLQAMMKDQFGNYVVQKVLETCDDRQRELILSRVKVHLNALKKYTYGKHIVARVEKLVVAGERRIGLQSMYLS